MRVLIAGAGAFGSYIAEDLVVQGHEVFVLDKDKSVVGELRERLPAARCAVGDACEPGQLEPAGVLRADAVVAATGDDEDNLVIALLARKEFDVPRVIARVNDPRNFWLFTPWWGVDQPLSAPDALVAVIEEQVASAPPHEEHGPHPAPGSDDR
jgi:trk/ktr system potassium uptake protein